MNYSHFSYRPIKTKQKQNTSWTLELLKITSPSLLQFERFRNQHTYYFRALLQLTMIILCLTFKPSSAEDLIKQHIYVLQTLED